MSTFLGLNSSRSSLRRILQAATRCSQKPLELGPASRCLTTRQWHSIQSHACIRRPPLRIGQDKARIWHYPMQQAQHLSFFPAKVLTSYVDIPPTYKDEDGLPFGNHAIGKQEATSVFGPHMDPQSADKLLRILHGRRVAGTLQDPAYTKNTAQFRQQDIQKGLAYLRKHVPVDEVINAGLRAEDELRELAEAAARKERGEKEEEAPAEKKDGKVRGGKLFFRNAKDVYGEGAFDRIRARNIAKREAEEKRLAEEKKKKEEEEAKSRPGGLQKIDLSKPREPSPWIKQYLVKGQSDLQEPPEMSKWARLAPTTIAAVMFLTMLLLVCNIYEPPDQGDRLLHGMPAAHATVIALVAMNFLVYAAWKFPPAWQFMNRYFIMVPATPRPFTLLGALFSHQKLMHFFWNMVFLTVIGTRLHDEVGRGDLVAAYLGSGVFGFLCSFWAIILRDRLHLTTLGASGGVYGIAAAYFWMHRFEAFKIFGLPPDPYNGVQGLAILALMIALNLRVVLPGTKTIQRLDVMSHFGGMAFGVAYAAYITQFRGKSVRSWLQSKTQKDESLVHSASGNVLGEKGQDEEKKQKH